MNPAKGIFTLYVGRMFLIRFLGLLLFFVIVLQMLDLLNRSSDIMATEGAGVDSLTRYILLRAPMIASQFTPFAALLGIVFTLAGLSHTSEITVMRAAGMSVYRVLFPIGFVCALIAIAHFTLHETVTIKSTDALDYWEVNDFAVNLPPKTDTRTDVRIYFDREYISAESASRSGDAILLSGVTIYTLDEDDLLHESIEAQSAKYDQNEGWVLSGSKRMRAKTSEVIESDTALWTNSLDPELLFALTLVPDRTGLGELVSKIRQLNKDGTDTRAAMTSLLSRFSKPLSTLVMPLLGAIAGFGVHRQGVLLARAVMGSGLGFTYFVAENMALALGKLGVLPAIIGAFFPFALFMVVGFSILVAMEN